jgi:hypothetical protein
VAFVGHDFTDSPVVYCRGERYYQHGVMSSGESTWTLVLNGSRGSDASAGPVGWSVVESIGELDTRLG